MKSVIRSFAPVVRSAHSIRSSSSSESESRRPMKRIRTPCSPRSGTSRRIRSVNSSIRPSTSHCGRVQFSVENAYTVSSRTPRSSAARTVRLSASTPRRWPSSTGSPRSDAQRAFPSMMIATYRAANAPPGAGGRSDLHDLLLLRGKRGVDLADARVGELLQLGLRPVLLVAADLALLLQLAQVVHDVAADVADGDPALLRDPAHDTGEVVAALLGELGDDEPDDLAVVRRRQPDVRLENAALDRLDRRLVVRRHRQQPRLAGGDARE